MIECEWPINTWFHGMCIPSNKLTTLIKSKVLPACNKLNYSLSYGDFLKVYDDLEVCQQNVNILVTEFSKLSRNFLFLLTQYFPKFFLYPWEV